MKAAGRVVRLWALFASLDVTWMMRDLGSFVATIFADIVGIMAAITAMLLLAERFGGLGTWTQAQVTFMLGYAVTVQGALEMLFGYNVVYISRRIGHGQLDHILVQPQPMWLTLLTEGFSPCAGGPILLARVLLLYWGAAAAGVAVTAGWLILLLANLAGSCTIVVAFSYVAGSLAFWAPRAAEEVNSSSWRLLTQLRTFPLDGVGIVLLGGLLSAVPVGFVAWYPVRTLVGLDTTPLAALATPLAAVPFAAVALWVFSRGMQHYGRTGSQRYLSHGHRR